MSLALIYGRLHASLEYPTLLAMISLFPAITLAPLVRIQGKTPASMTSFINIYSIIATGIALIILAVKFLAHLDFAFAFFVLPGFLMILKSYFSPETSTTRSTLMRAGATWLSIGYFYSFFYFVGNLVPKVADDEHFWIDGGIFTNWHVIKSIFAIIGYFLALSVSRSIQRITREDRPSFLLVILGYSSLLLLVNFMIITFCNDLGVALTTGGPRAVMTTLWWIILSIMMLMIGIHFGHGYRSEKLL